ncbi:hypothetical protein JTE90_027346 [Oedothorax gibbosus]|uniref:Major facilitator superfamily (MFS) profile domain-containing protein n=1 Tax=Oedothorax gibbosus TaxID=931172 RepID=A0AAV6VXY3_9ARAC|nr:hypothetical protein JTE90_027346 [Oedothorax gibbosus]
MEGVTWHFLFAIAAAALGSGFQNGYNTGVVNVTQRVIEKFINSTYKGKAASKSALEFQYSLMVSVFCLGGMVGPLFTSFLSENLGRKAALIFNCLFVFVAAALMGFAKMAGIYHLLVLGRFVIGINAGLNSSLVPMYLSEICPIYMRGAVGTVYQLVLVICILLSQILGLPEILGNDKHWPFLYGLIILPAVFMVLTLPFCPESPRFLLIVIEDPVSAKKALEWFRGTSDVSNEIISMTLEHEQIRQMPKVGFANFRKDPVLKKCLTMAIIIMLAQQFSGINAVIYYSTKTLTKAGAVSEGKAVYATLAMGIINVLMTVVSLYLVDTAGRKTLLIVGMAGTLLTNLILTISMVLTARFFWMAYISMIGIAAFVIFFAAGLGSIPWFLVAELFEQAPRPLAMTIAASINWFANFIISVGFLPVADLIGPYVFLCFAVAMALCLIYTYREIPETKNRTILEIKDLINDKCS